MLSLTFGSCSLSWLYKRAHLCRHTRTKRKWPVLTRYLCNKVGVTWKNLSRVDCFFNDCQWFPWSRSQTGLRAKSQDHASGGRVSIFPLPVPSPWLLTLAKLPPHLSYLLLESWGLVTALRSTSWHAHVCDGPIWAGCCYSRHCPVDSLMEISAVKTGLPL